VPFDHRTPQRFRVVAHACPPALDELIAVERQALEHAREDLLKRRVDLLGSVEQLVKT